MFAIPAFLAVTWRHGQRKRQVATWATIFVIFIIFVGFRHEVGGDWGNYLRSYNALGGLNFEEAVLSTDIGYAFVSWLASQLGYGIYAVNFICGTIFISGLIMFCRQQANPWLAFTIAVPYVVNVIAMGYTRQGVALGLLFMAIVSLERQSFKTYLMYIIAATLFHKTALLMIPLGLFLYGKGRLARAVAIIATAYGLWDLLLAESQERLWSSYIDVNMQSEGARIRVFMNVVPALILLLYRKRWRRIFPNYGFWVWLSIGSIISVPLVEYASTAVDRIALYLTPVQIAVFSRLAWLIKGRSPSVELTTGIVACYALVLFVWLNYALHAKYWLPYKNMLFI